MKYGRSALSRVGVAAALDRGALGLFEQPDKLGQCPDVIGNAGVNSRRRAERLVDAAEVVVHETDADGRARFSTFFEKALVSRV